MNVIGKAVEWTAEVNLKNFKRLYLVLAAFCLKTKKTYSNQKNIFKYFLLLWSIRYIPSERRRGLKAQITFSVRMLSTLATY